MGILERKEREKLMRRDTIVRAAEAVFFEKGLRAATLEEVAERAEVSKGTIYLYFSSKEDLYCSLMTRGLRLLLGAFHDAGPEDREPVEALTRLGNAYLQFSLEQSYLFRMLSVLETPSVSEKVSHGVFSELEEASDNVLGYVATFVQKGIDDGTFRADIPAHEAVVLFWVSLSGVLNLKQRSSSLRGADILNADSIIGSVDFDSLYSKCQIFLMNLLSAGKTGKQNRRVPGSKVGAIEKKAKGVGRK